MRQELCAGVDAGKSDPHCVVRGIDGLQRPTNACGPINTEHMTTGVLQRHRAHRRDRSIGSALPRPTRVSSAA